jgi:predicted flap endonuclease-1-like 5' DNA nuclease
MRFLWFVLGLVIGSAGMWIWLQRRCVEQVADVRANWERKVRHLEDEVGRADQAHEETKERLRAATERLQQLEAECARLQAELALAKPQAAGSDAREQQAAAAANTEPSAGEEPVAPRGGDGGDAAQTPPAAGARGDARTRRLREIDAKLAQLPAGSSARRRLLEERQRLAGNPAVAGTASAVGVHAEVEPVSQTADDLMQIKGIGPKIADQLRALGITSIEQIALLSPQDVARIDEVLAFKGRIERERWIEQARALMAARSSGS